MYRNDDPNVENAERVLRFQPGIDEVRPEDAVEVYHNVGQAVVKDGTVELEHGGSWMDEYDEFERETLEGVEEVLSSQQNRAEMNALIYDDEGLFLDFSRIQEATVFESEKGRTVIFSRI